MCELCLAQRDCHSFTVQPEMLTRAHIVDKYSLFGLFQDGSTPNKSTNARTNDRMNRPRHTFDIYTHTDTPVWCAVLLVK